MKRLLTIALTLLACSASMTAQRTYVDLGGVQSPLNEKIDLKRSSFHVDLGVGNALEAGFHIQRNFNRIVSWDVVGLRYAWQYIPKGDNPKKSLLCLTTGFRFHTPAFGENGNMKAYLALGLGYGGYRDKYTLSGTYYYNYKSYNKEVDKDEWNSRLVVSVEAGVYLSRCFYLGASASFIGAFRKDMIYSPYVLRIGFEF